MHLEVERDRGMLGFQYGQRICLEGKSISDLVRMHALHESQCGSLIEQQEKLTRRIHRNGILSGSVMEKTLSRSEAGAEHQSDHWTGFADFRRRYALASLVNPESLPAARRRFAEIATNADLSEIEDLEERIGLERVNMSLIEQVVFDCIPTTSLDAVSKLKFLTSLLLDGGEVEQDYFAYLVEECAIVLEVKLAKSDPSGNG